MQRRLESVLDQLGQVQTFEGLKKSILGLQDLYEIDHLVYHSLNSTGQQYAVLTYQDEWVNHYIDSDYARIDPVVLGCFQRFHPIEWKRLDWSGKAAREFMGEAVDAGVGTQGFSVPIRGPNGQFALFTVNNNSSDQNWERFTDRHLGDLLLASHFINQKALALEMDTDQPRDPKIVKTLSPRETESLTLLALGMKRAQVAENMKISENTLRSYIESARVKLGALNTTHAVANAVTRGLLLV